MIISAEGAPPGEQHPLGRRGRRQVRVGAPDTALTANAGMAAVTELCRRLGVIEALDAAVGPVKPDRGFGGRGAADRDRGGAAGRGGLPDRPGRQRSDTAGQQVTPVPGLASTTAAGLARRITPAQWQAIEQGVAAVTGRTLLLLPAQRAAALADGPVTIDLDTTDVEVYGAKKRGVACNHQGQRVGLAARGGLGRDRDRAGRRPGRRATMGYSYSESFIGKSAMSEASERSAEQPTRIDEIATQWSLLRLAHQSSISVAGPARNVLVLRYSRAIRGYVGAMVKDVEDADELAQEVVVRLLQGSFARANPERGRFRDMLKVAVRNVVLTYWTQKRRRAQVDVDVAQLPGEGEETQIDQEWTAAWQRSVLDMTWAAMEDYARAHPQSVSWIILRLRADHPEDDLAQLAAPCATDRQIPAPAALRQQLRRARLRFAELLVEEVAKSLDGPTPERVEEELIETGLMPYVHDFLPSDWRTRGELREVP